MGESAEIELLAPARDLETGRAAVDSGADAVYIGGPVFGARHAAGNSIDDIAELVRYARPFGVRVYATLNTVLFDDELAAAEQVARELIAVGVDALIVQDMAWLRMGLCDVEFHASTQVSNIAPAEIAFLGRAGFRRVILERALSLDEIRAIRAATDAGLEVFVHGAICVGYSGRCFMSRAICRGKQADAMLCSSPNSSHASPYASNSAPSQALHVPATLDISVRSGNRGSCSQPCRLAYDLTDGETNVIIKGKHLLSLRDLDLSAHLGELLDAGVTSFKIEGRLKDVSYVRNVVGHYRRLLDAELALRPSSRRTSVGGSRLDFTPDPSKSFTRGATDYFFGGVGGHAMVRSAADGAKVGAKVGADNGVASLDTAGKVASFDTPKVMGEPVGRVERVDCERTGNRFFTLKNIAPAGLSAVPAGIHGVATRLAAGDGICFFAGGELQGTNINRVESGRIYPNKIEGITAGTEIFRNYDHAFTRVLERSRAKRYIGVSARITMGATVVSVGFTDETGLSVEVSRTGVFDEARDPAKMLDTLREQISRSGNTIFDVRAVEIAGSIGRAEVPDTFGEVAKNVGSVGGVVCSVGGIADGNDGAATSRAVRFVPVSVLNELRREGLQRLLEAREQLVPERRPSVEDMEIKFPRTRLTAAENVTNRLAEQFYRDHGVARFESPLELRNSLDGEVVMHSRYCIRREVGQCLRENGKSFHKVGQGHCELFLERGTTRFRLGFDCENCEMTVTKI